MAKFAIFVVLLAVWSPMTGTAQPTSRQSSLFRDLLHELFPSSVVTPIENIMYTPTDPNTASRKSIEQIGEAIPLDEALPVEFSTKFRAALPEESNTGCTIDLATVFKTAQGKVLDAFRDYQPKYQVRAGTIDNGKNYEYKMCALLSLRCILHGVEDMWLASNAEGAGAFDDVILQVKLPGADPLTCMLQLKHKDEKSTIQEKEFLAPRGNFSLRKYLQDIEELHQEINCDTKKQIVKDLGDFGNIYLVIFTNRETQDSKLLQEDAESSLPSFLNTSSKNAYKFNVTELVGLDAAASTAKFYLLPGQVNANHADEQIVIAVKKLSKQLGLSKPRIKEIAEAFTTFVMEWSRGSLGGHFRLSRNDILFKLTDLFLKQYAVDLREQPFDGQATHQMFSTWNKIIARRNISIVDADEAAAFLIQHLASEVQAYSKEPMLGWDRPLSREAQQRFYEEQTHIKTHMLQRIGNWGRVTPFDILKCVWSIDQVPLLLKVSSPDDYPNILNILKLSNCQLKVIILSEGIELPSRTPTDGQRLESVEDLDQDNITQVLGQTVKIQGRGAAILKDLVTTDTLKHIKCKDIVKLFLRGFNIGLPIEPLSDYFVKRSLLKTVVKSQVLQTSQDAIILVNGNLQIFDTVRARTMEDLDFSNQGSISGVISIEGPINPQQLKKFKATEKAIHILSVLDENHLDWIWSYGSTKVVDQLTTELDYTIEEPLPDKTMIVSAAPGMGKSLLMDFLAQKVPADKWVLRVDSNRYQSYLKHPNCKSSTTEAWEHLLGLYQDDGTALARAVFENLAKSGRTLVVIDGFDEISVSYKEEATNLAKSLHKGGCQVWVTTRPVMKTYLEDLFETKSVTIKPFSMEDQKEFLIWHFTSELGELSPSVQPTTIAMFAEQLLRTIRTTLNDWDNAFAGVPLQTRLLANAFTEKCREYLRNNEAIVLGDNFDLLSLYQTFIDNKIAIFVEKYGDSALNFNANVKEHIFLLAVQLLFPLDNSEWDAMKSLCDTYTKEPGKRQLLQCLGLISVDEKFNISCIHRTIAEYMAARWISYNITNPDGRIKELLQALTKERFSENYNFLFYLLDRMLCENLPLHLAIINKQMDQVDDILDTDPGAVAETDKGGRLALHVAALCGVQYPMPFDQFIPQGKASMDKILEITKKLLHKGVKCSNTDFLGYSPLCYALGNRSLAIADVINTKLKKPTIGASIDLNLKEDYLKYCHSYHPNLYETLLPYFASRDLLLKNTPESVQVTQYTGLQQDRSRMTLVKLLQSEYGSIHSGFVGRLFPSYYADVRYAIVYGSKRSIQKGLKKDGKLNEQDVDGCTPLHYAVLHEKPEIVKKLLKRGADPNKQNNDKNTPLHLAALNPNIGTITLLLSKGANINAANRMGDTVLHLAIQKCDSSALDKLWFKTINKIIKLSVLKGLDVNSTNKKGETALHCALKNNASDVAIVAYLLKKGSDVNRKTYNQQTPLHLALGLGDKKTIKLLLSKGAHTNAQNGDGDTPLHLACVKEQVDLATTLLKRGAVLDTRNNVGNTPLHAALIRGYPLTAELLLTHGADFDKQNKEGDSPLHMALRAGLRQSAKVLTEKGADLNGQNQDGDTPLHVAVNRGFTFILESLITEVNVNMKNSDGNTPLHLASIAGLVNAVTLLLRKGSNIDEKNKKGSTSLHLALVKGYTPIVQLLLDKGSVDVANDDGDTSLHLASSMGWKDMAELFKKNDINSKNLTGNTPLHLALLKGYTSIAELLINNTADINLQNASGNTALHLALLGGYASIGKALVAKRACIGTKNAEGNTPLHLASTRLHFVDFAQQLLLLGANVNAENNQGDTPLHLAASKGCEETLRVLLLKDKIDINARNHSGNTPLHVAVVHEHVNVAKLLLNNTSIRTVNNEGNSPLHLAAMATSEDAVRLLLKEGADVTSANGDGDTPLHLVATGVRSNIANLLLTKETNFNAQNKNGDTPLHLACFTGWLDTVKMLLKVEIINVNARNREGNTPLHMALMVGWKQTVQLLLDKGAELNAVNNEGNTPLHFALLKESTGVSELLIAKGANVNLANSDGISPLHFASTKFYASTPMLLLSKGADINALNRDGNTPLHLAAQMGFAGVVKLLINEGALVSEHNESGNTPLELALKRDDCTDIVDLLLS